MHKQVFLKNKEKPYHVGKIYQLLRSIKSLVNFSITKIKNNKISNKVH